MTKLIALNDGEHRETAGSIAFWKLASTRASALAAKFEAAGLSADMLPRRATEATALHRAVNALALDGFARPIKDDGPVGFVLVRETYADGRPVYTNSTEFRWLTEERAITMSPFEETMAAQCSRQFAHFLDHHDHNDLSAWLVRFTAAQQAVRLRDSGGVYFIPRAGMPLWRKVTAAVAAAGRSEFYEVPALDSAEAASAVLASLRAESEAAIEKLMANFSADTTSERGCELRLKAIAKLRAKLTYYEDLLGGALPEIRERLTTAEVLLAETQLVAGAA